MVLRVVREREREEEEEITGQRSAAGLSTVLAFV